jgi:hypothetical protein
MKHKHFVLAVLVSGFAMSMTACGGEKNEAKGENSDSTKTAETKEETKEIPAQTIAVNKSFTLVRHSDFTTSPETAEVTVVNIMTPFTDKKVVDPDFIVDGNQLVRVELSIKNVNKEVPYSMTSGEIQMQVKDTVYDQFAFVTESYKKNPEYFGEMVNFNELPLDKPVTRVVFFSIPDKAAWTDVKIVATSHLKNDKKETVGVDIQ